MSDFNPTHKITRGGETILVMLEDGAAYTREEWDCETQADYERNEAGEWLFQGQAFSGEVADLEDEIVYVIEVQEYNGWEDSPRDAIFGDTPRAYDSEREAIAARKALESGPWEDADSKACEGPVFVVATCTRGDLSERDRRAMSQS